MLAMVFTIDSLSMMFSSGMLAVAMVFPVACQPIAIVFSSNYYVCVVKQLYVYLTEFSA